MMNGENTYAIINYIDECGEFDTDFVPNGEIACKMSLDYFKDSKVELVSIKFVEKEVYLNEKLSYRLNEHEELHEEMKDVCSKYLNDKMSRDVTVETLLCIKENIQTCENQIQILMNRIQSADVELAPRNELAVELIKDIHRKEQSFQ